MKALIGPAEVRRLMREHGVTIRELAARMDITMKRVREIRNGTGGPLSWASAIDVHEAIAGTMTPSMREQLRSYTGVSAVERDPGFEEWLAEFKPPPTDAELDEMAAYYESPVWPADDGEAAVEFAEFVSLAA